MSGVVIAAIHTAWCNNFNRQLTVHPFHSMNLTARSLRTQHNLVIDIERILHITCWVIRWQVQRFKIVIIALDFRTFCYFKAKSSKDALSIVDYLGQWMQVALRHAGTWQCNVEGFSSKFGVQRLSTQVLGLFFQRMANSVTHRIGQFTNDRTFFFRQFSHTFENRGQFPFFTQVFDTQFVNFFKIILILNGFKCSLFDLH